VTTIFRVRVEAVDGPHLTLDVNHVYGWDWNTHLVNSRTLALHFLWEPLLGYIRSDIPSPGGRRITRAEADASALTLPLGRQLAGRDHTDETWNRANVGRFIACVGVADRRDHHELWNDAFHEYWDTHERGEFPVARARYRVAATDPGWLAHLAPGMEWDSTAYDHDEPVAVGPAWRTSTVTALAEVAWRTDDFGVLPVLADALDQAGCDNPDILGHVRGPGPHVRGCWVLDMLLAGVAADGEPAAAPDPRRKAGGGT
jgi:hypothetical protein